MDETITRFLEVLRAALEGKPAAPADAATKEEWEALFRMAGIHHVLPLVYGAVHKAPGLKTLDPGFLGDIRQQVIRQVASQTVRTQEFLALNRDLQEKGIEPVVVKGIICRNLYPQPDYRPSTDEDLLIPAHRYEDCHGELLARGMEPVGQAEPEAYEVPYRKKGGMLYIELHKQLFPPLSDAYGDLNRFFEDVHKTAVAEALPGGTVYTLAPTDHLFYLICHAFKHFLHSGFGIRQVCDIILYANRYGAALDWQRVLENCRAIRAEKFAAAIFRIGGKYLVFDEEKATYPAAWRDIPVDEIPMLGDLLSAGVYGGATMSRKHSSAITLDAVAARKQGRKSRNAVLLSAFPSASKLEGRYPYLKKHPYLLPVAWCSRLITYSGEVRRSGDNDAAEALKIGNARIALLKTYDIL